MDAMKSIIYKDKNIELEPLAGRILLKPIIKTEHGNIILPKNQEVANQGLVVALGYFKNSPVKVGDKVIFKERLLDSIMVNKEKFLVAKEEDILAKIQKTINWKKATW